MKIPELEELTMARGFVPVLLDGTPTGFELYSREITDQRRQSYRKRLELNGEAPDEFVEVLDACDLTFGFTSKAGDRHEVMAARIVATTLAAAAQGWFSDPQTGETIRFATDRRE